MVNSLQNQQKKFDATLNKERERADGLEADKDAYEKKCRDLESKVLSLQAELEDNNEKLLDSERIRKQVILFELEIKRNIYISGVIEP